MPMDLAVAPLTTEAATEYVDQLQAIWRKVQEKLAAQSAKDAKRADKARRQAKIEVGDFVLLNAKNLRLKAKPGKLRPLYVGPYQVLRAIGRNAFKLKLPEALKVHNVFNVALLKPYLGDRLIPADVEVEGDREYEVEAIVRHRGRPKHY